MSTARHHADWLSLVEVSGPFVSLPVLLRTFPQGLEARDPAQAKQLRAAYEDWQDNPAAPGKQRAWVLHVLGELLGYPASQIAEGQSLPAGLEANMAEQGETLRPDFALIGPAGTNAVGQAQLLISSYPAAQPLDKPVIGKHWKATPATRMMELLHGTNVPLGLVTNGEQWMLVYAPRGETTGYASWFGALWLDEPITLRAFQSLMGVRRFFGVAADNTLLALLKESASDQQEVTDQLGYQVREAVEVLVQSFDAIHQESQGVALKGVPPTMVYDAALTIMMRLVFLFSAEERGLLHLGKPLYDDNYAVSTLQEQLQEVADQNGEEVLERRYDAWTRLLATFRAVHGGIQHQDLLMQAYGGSLFDPDRYPFLEGRAAGSNWRGQSAEPLPVNNRVVLHLLNSLQRLRIKTGGAAETRRVSFRALGVEQIGHVYEGLLDHTAQRATEVVLGIRGTRSKEPEIPLSTLELLLAKGEDALLEYLKEETGRSLPALRKELNSSSVLDEHKLLVACRQDEALLARLRPFVGLIREDSFERPWVVLPGSVFVTTGTTRRSTGTHYTPPSLTEPIVRHTLEPLVYSGPSEGLPKEQWKLKSPKEILELKVCDMAMGSGAFLVQACRYLAERLVEAWENEEKAHPGQVLITPDGKLSDGSPTERLVPIEAAERIAIARRVVADRCLYGVDINPMAVEMAKLSMWLITVDKSRPFTFIDHAFKCGDSLLGITSLKQLENFSMRTDGGKQRAFATQNLLRHIDEAKKKRETLEAMPSDTPEQILTKTKLYAEAEDAVAILSATADLLISLELKGLKGRTYDSEREVISDRIATCFEVGIGALKEYAKHSSGEKNFLHWIISFPEVMQKGGFDAFIGNPPFAGGKKLSGLFGSDYREYLVSIIANQVKGNADLSAFFLLRIADLLNSCGMSGIITTNTIAQGDTRDVGLDQLVARGLDIPRAIQSMSWPGVAAIDVSLLWLSKRKWLGPFLLDDAKVSYISSMLKVPGKIDGRPFRLARNSDNSYQGCVVLGKGFVLNPHEADLLKRKSPKNIDCLSLYLNGDDLNSRVDQSASRYVINFKDWPLKRTNCGSWVESTDIEKKAWLRAGVVPDDYPDPVASDYPDLLDILDKEVRPVRALVKRPVYRDIWWQFAEKQKSLYSRISGLKKVLVKTQVSSSWAFEYVNNGIVFDQRVAVLCDNPLALLQSSIHWTWSTHYGSSMRNAGYNYALTDCFETFPFPEDVSCLETIENIFLKKRRELLDKYQIGLTTLDNFINDPSNQSEDVVQFRSVIVDLDYKVARAYGWEDLDLCHGFQETKQGIRFTISELTRGEVLDRLLALNHQRYAEEVAVGLHNKKSAQPAKTQNISVAVDANLQDDLFDQEPIAATPLHLPASGPSSVVEYLRANPGWHSKDGILTATGFPDNRWNVAIRELMDSGQVIRQGEKRGAKYRFAETQN
ncbi:Eco57I restriction-modification methylase domain-containing protein [Limnohabitans sp. DCL3]|uniref:Eco57I restriction-modification methylase domain-containing protein n=1 Tax=Limnohabitans sp. DCL3 TaxID=3374103 RepID=UPI003A8687A8